MPKLDDLMDFEGEENVYEVEKIVGVHRQPGKPPLYRVRWKGYGPEEDTYEPRDHLLTCEDMIDEYLLDEEKKQEEAAVKKEKKKPLKRKHSGESPPLSPHSSASDAKEVHSNEGEEAAVGDVQGTSQVNSGGSANAQEDDDDDGDVDPRDLLKDPFWNDLENGVIVPNLFETDMYSKVKSRRATLEAKRKKKEEETEEQKNSSLSESQSSDKSSPGNVSKKKESPPKQEDGPKRHKKKKHSDKHDPGKKKKKKKSHKSKKKRRHIKMDLEAIGSLESATQKSLKMSPSDLDGSDNSANLFISCKPAEEVLTVAKLLEQSRHSSSHSGSQSSDGCEDSDPLVSAKDIKATETKADSSLNLVDLRQSDQSHDMGFLSPDLEKMLERNPFSLNEETDSESATAPQSSQDAVPPEPSREESTTLSTFGASPSLWDQFAKELPSCKADSPLPSSISGSNSSHQNINKLVKKEPVDSIPEGSVTVKKEMTDPMDKRSNDILQSETTSVSLNDSVESGLQHNIIRQKSGIESPTVIKEEPVDSEETVDALKVPSLAGEKSLCGISSLANTVTKQESLEIPDSIEDHLNVVEPELETVLKSESLGTMEELPNLTGNLFDNFLPANSPFTDDEQRNSGSEEPKIDVGQLLSSLEDKEMPSEDTAMGESQSSVSATTTSVDVAEKADSVKESTDQEATNNKDVSEPGIPNGEGKQTVEPSSLMWPWSGPGPLTSPQGDITKEEPEDVQMNTDLSHESRSENYQKVQGASDVPQGSDAADVKSSDEHEKEHEEQAKKDQEKSESSHEEPEAVEIMSKISAIVPGSRSMSPIASQENGNLTTRAAQEISKVVTKETESVCPKGKSANDNSDSNLFDALKSCLNKNDKRKQKSKTKEDAAQGKVFEDAAPLKDVEDAAPFKDDEDADTRKAVKDLAPREGTKDLTCKKQVDDATPIKDAEDAASRNVVDEVAPRKGAEDAAPRNGVENALCSKGVKDAALRKGVEDASSKKFVEDAAPRKGVEDAASRKGVEDAPPRKGIKDTVAMRDAEDNAPREVVDDVAHSNGVVSEVANVPESEKSQTKTGGKSSVSQKDKQSHPKSTKASVKQPKKQTVVLEKAKESSKSNKVTKISRKDEDKNSGHAQIPQKGTDKTTGGNKDNELKKKQLHTKPEEKKKKKITGGSWKFESISEIPRNDENKVPMDLIDKNSTLDEDFLCKAITEGDFHLVQAVLHNCPTLKVDSPNSRGQRPLVLACMGGQNEILKKLILSRATVDVRLNNGVTPLMIAAELGYTSTAGILLEAGASVNLSNTSGETALIKASRKGHVDVVQLLLHYGADWGQTSQENTSALSLAKQHKMYQVSEVLQKHEQRMVEQLEYGITQYMWGTARLVHSVLPSRCFRMRESTQHHIKFNFDPTKIPFSPTFGTMLFLCHVSPGVSGMSCHLSGPCHVKEVTLNGVPTNPVPEGNRFVMEFIPKAGVNALNITTHHDPYTKMLLLVAAYSLQLIQS